MGRVYLIEVCIHIWAVPFRCSRPLSCGVDGEPLQLRLQGLTCPQFPRESVALRCTALSDSANAGGIESRPMLLFWFLGEKGAVPLRSTAFLRGGR
ncbi:hypothetical protein [Rossellomorea marisflavi]|uniref:hypothetical protein n=1 Tax=Rossellomorea marisflavi TaxID=189381 RepID=UPI003566D5A1